MCFRCRPCVFETMTNVFRNFAANVYVAVSTASPPCHHLHHTVHHGHATRTEVQRALCEATSPHDHDHERCTLFQPSTCSQTRFTNRSLKVLGGIADTVAQTLTALRLRQRQKALHSRSDSNDVKDDFFAIEIGELDSKRVPWPEDDFMVPASKRGPPPFDFERLTRFMAYGFLMAPIQHKWFAFLESTFPIGGGKATSNALRRVAFDQLIFAPCGRCKAKLGIGKANRYAIQVLQPSSAS